VEILKFSEPPKRSSSKNTRKKSGVMPLLSVVAAVAIVGGMSSTLAGTITLNTGTAVEFGQGVITAAACDTSITVLPTSQYESNTAVESTQFVVSSIQIKNLGFATGGNNGDGCKGKVLTIKSYTANGTLLSWNAAKDKYSIKFTLPNQDTLTAGSQISKDTDSSGVGIADGDISSTYSTSKDSDDSGQYFSISNLRIPSSVVKFTIESSSSS
jgi:hypothetical protein